MKYLRVHEVWIIYFGFGSLIKDLYCFNREQAIKVG